MQHRHLVLIVLVACAPAALAATAADPLAHADCESTDAPSARSEFLDASGLRLIVHTLCERPDAEPSALPDLGLDCASPAFQPLDYKWSMPFAVRLDAAASGLDAAGVREAYDLSGLAWDIPTATALWGGVTEGGSASAVGRYDGVNQVGWGRLGAGVIAVTYTWAEFTGEAVESDAEYSTRFAWSLTGESGKMDVQNIATHEIGHTLGLDHPVDSYANECLTMYAYAEEGETQKRTLGLGDVLGIRALYP